MISTKQLIVFARIAECKNMHAAADAMTLTQSALSQQLRQLEERLGVKLFERVPKGMELSPAGRELLPYARAVLSALGEFEEVARVNGEDALGTLRLGVTPTIGPYLMPAAIAQLHRTYPKLRIIISEGIPEIQQRQLVEGELDLLISPLPIRGRGLHIEPLFREPLRIVAPPDDRLLSLPKRVKSDYADRAFLSVDRRHHFHRQIAEICDELDARILPDYEGTSLDALQQMAGTGVALAVLPQFYLESGAGGLGVVHIAEPDGWVWHRSIAASWRINAAYARIYGEIAAIIAQEAHARLAV